MIPILSKPHAGWTEVVIGDFSDSASYLDDVPVLTLTAMLSHFRTGNPFCVEYDAEGHEYIIVSTYFETIVIGYEDTQRFDISVDELAKELVRDIEDNIDLWARWNPGVYEEDESEEVEKTKSRITDLVGELKLEIAEHDKRIARCYE